MRWHTKTGKVVYHAFWRNCRGKNMAAVIPKAWRYSPDGRTLFSADAISDTVRRVRYLSHPSAGKKEGASGIYSHGVLYPTVVLATANYLLIGSAKGRGIGAESGGDQNESQW